ncbi:MAG: ABC transporter ATP-binding protein [Pseudomonadota bacterium]
MTGGLGQAGPGSFRWLQAYVRPHRARLAAVFVLSLSATGLSLLQPYITKWLIDGGLLAKDMAVVIQACLVMLLVGVLGAGLSALNRWHYVTLSGRVLFALREAVYRHLQTLSPRFYVKARGGDLLTRLDGDIAEVQRFAIDSALALVSGVIGLVGALGFMVLLNWQLSLLALILLPAQVLFLRHMRPRVETMTRTVRERASDIGAFFFDTLGAMKLVQSVAAEERVAGHLGTLNRGYLGDLLRLQMTNVITAAVPNLMTLLSTILVFMAGGYLVIHDQMTLGALVAFTAYLTRATGPVQTLLGLYVALQRARVSLRRVAEIAEQPPDVQPPAQPAPWPSPSSGALCLKGVCFRYDPAEPPVLDGVEASIPGGAKVAITGLSGAGKSTLIDLLQRHFDPDQGRILLDGTDLRALDLSTLRRRVAVVAQDTLLLPGTIAENIRFAAPESSDDALREAARLAQIEAFVETLPEGYETLLGGRGLRLSGGQRQRLAIARALLQDPLVLVFDEATSGIDRTAEAEIMAAVDELFATRTRIVITHRHDPGGDFDLVFELAESKLGEVARS